MQTFPISRFGEIKFNPSIIEFDIFRIISYRRVSDTYMDQSPITNSSEICLNKSATKISFAGTTIVELYIKDKLYSTIELFGMDARLFYEYQKDSNIFYVYTNVLFNNYIYTIKINSINSTANYAMEIIQMIKLNNYKQVKNLVCYIKESILYCFDYFSTDDGHLVYVYDIEGVSLNALDNLHNLLQTEKNMSTIIKSLDTTNEQSITEYTKIYNKFNNLIETTFTEIEIGQYSAIGSLPIITNFSGSSALTSTYKALAHFKIKPHSNPNISVNNTYDRSMLEPLCIDLYQTSKCNYYLPVHGLSLYEEFSDDVLIDPSKYGTDTLNNLSLIASLLHIYSFIDNDNLKTENIIGFILNRAFPNRHFVSPIYYGHTIFQHDESFEITKISVPFIFTTCGTTGINFGCGLIETDNEYIISYSTDDANAFLLTINKTEIPFYENLQDFKLTDVMFINNNIKYNLEEFIKNNLKESDKLIFQTIYSNINNNVFLKEWISKKVKDLIKLIPEDIQHLFTDANAILGLQVGKGSNFKEKYLKYKKKYIKLLQNNK